MIIYAVQKENSYGDFGDSYISSYHKTEEGAFLALDKEGNNERLLLKDTYGGRYYYTDNDGRSISVIEIKVEE